MFTLLLGDAADALMPYGPSIVDLNTQADLIVIGKVSEINFRTFDFEIEDTLFSVAPEKLKEIKVSRFREPYDYDAVFLPDVANEEAILFLKTESPSETWKVAGYSGAGWNKIINGELLYSEFGTPVLRPSENAKDAKYRFTKADLAQAIKDFHSAFKVVPGKYKNKVIPIGEKSTLENYEATSPAHEYLIKSSLAEIEKPDLRIAKDKIMVILNGDIILEVPTMVAEQTNAVTKSDQSSLVANLLIVVREHSYDPNVGTLDVGKQAEIYFVKDKSKSQ